METLQGSLTWDHPVILSKRCASIIRASYTQQGSHKLNVNNDNGKLTLKYFYFLKSYRNRHHILDLQDWTVNISF